MSNSESPGRRRRPLLAPRQIRFDEFDDTITKAVDLAGNCQEAYRLAPDSVRRQLNQGFVERLLVDWERSRVLS
jgi:hypothetical protein